MKLFDKLDKIYFNHKYVAKLKGYKLTKELAHELLWAFENDLTPYAKEKKIKLTYEVLPSSIVHVLALLPESLNKNIEKYSSLPFDIDIIWIDYRDILWTILNYKEERNRAYERINKIANYILNQND